MENRTNYKFNFVTIILLFFIVEAFLNANGKGLPYLVTYLLGMQALLVIAICIIPSQFNMVRLNVGPFSIWMAFVFLLSVSVCTAKLGNILDFGVFLFGFTIVGVATCLTDKSKLLRAIQWSCIISATLFFILSIALYPYEILGSGYGGVLVNANGAGQYETLVYVCLLPTLLEKGLSKYKRLCSIIVGLDLGMLFMSGSRTALLSVAMATLLMVGIHLTRREKQEVLTVVKTLVIVVAAAILISLVAFSLSKTGAVEELNLLQEKISIEGKTADELSTGRLSIWKEFASHIKPFGVEGETHYYVGERTTVYTTAHNTILDYMVTKGLFAGICIALFYLVSFVKSVQLAIQNRGDEYHLFATGINMAFCVTAMLASLNSMFAYPIALFYYLVQGEVLFSRRINE
ncbi:MAG: O-antigen ligase family protein [Clostridiales bacterium]|nr:O-antigen ligase family protein [Candidatus Crickella merdequi]